MQRGEEERGLIFVCAAALATVLLAALPLGAQNGSGQQTPQQPATKATQADVPDRGQRVFEQNCARCHTSPEGFSPRISGTIARHMRMRANLSDADYKDLVHFLNP